jgi:hypothetical protein
MSLVLRVYGEEGRIMTVLELISGLEPATKYRIERLFHQLRVEFSDVLDARLVERCLQESVSAQRNARVQEYVPIFAHRLARERLVAMAEAKQRRYRPHSARD